MRTFLVVITVAQTVFLLAVFALLLVRRRLESARTAARTRERDRLAQVVTQALGGTIGDGDVLSAVDGCRSESVALVIQQHPGHDSERWEDVLRIIRRSRWFHTATTRYARSRFWWRRLIGARAFAVLGTRDHVRAVMSLVVDRHPAVRLAVIPFVHRAPEAELVGLLLDEAIKARRVARQYMFTSLLEIGPPLTPVLVDRLGHPASAFELGDLVRLAGALGLPSLLPTILVHATHANSGVRTSVARALGSFATDESRDVLRTLLADPDWQVRTRAATALGQIVDVGAAPALRAAAIDRNWWVRLRGTIALRQLGTEGACHLDDLANGPDRFARDMARYVLGLSDAAIQEHAA